MIRLPMMSEVDLIVYSLSMLKEKMTNAYNLQ